MLTGFSVLNPWKSAASALYGEAFTVAAPAVMPEEMPDGLGSVILAVKAPATAEALAPVAARLRNDGYVVSAQNGLNELTSARAVGATRTIGCFINFSADYIEPALIHFGGPGAFYIGELDGAITPRLNRLQADLDAWAGGPVRATDNIWGYLWGKQAYGAVLFATALTNESMADAIDEYRGLMIDLAREVLIIAEIQGVAPQGFDGFEPDVIRHGTPAEVDASIDRMVAVRRRDQKTRTGVWRNLAVRKRKIEVDAHFPPILDLAQEHGVAAPLLARMVEMIREIERGERPQARENLDELALTA